MKGFNNVKPKLYNHFSIDLSHFLIFVEQGILEVNTDNPDWHTGAGGAQNCPKLNMYFLSGSHYLLRTQILIKITFKKENVFYYR